MERNSKINTKDKKKLVKVKRSNNTFNKFNWASLDLNP